jgi:outer membrane protein assembly factor BamB
MTMMRVAAPILVGLVVGCVAAAGPSAGWRNDGTGRFPAATPPSEWSGTKNVLWKVALPGASYAAPVVAGENLYVVSDPSELLCVRRSDGKVLWKKDHSDIEAPAAKGGKGGKGGGGKGGGGKGGGGRSAGNTAATPAGDAERVAVVLGNGVVAVYTPDGKRVWARFVESPRIGFGPSASPLLIDGKVIVHLNDLVALDAATGKEAWRVVLPAVHASPVATKLGKDDVIVSPSGAFVRARDGKILSKGKFRASQSSPVVDGDTVFVSGSGSTEAFAISREEGGDVKLTSLWKQEGAGEKHHCPSAVVHDGLFYGLTNAGILDVVEAKTGKKVYRQRLPVGQVYSSITMAGGLLYVLDLQGKAAVFKPGRKFERVAVNELEGTGCCPVFAGEHLYVRGRQNLYCVSAKAGKQ